MWGNGGLFLFEFEKCLIRLDSEVDSITQGRSGLAAPEIKGLGPQGNHFQPTSASALDPFAGHQPRHAFVRGQRGCARQVSAQPSLSQDPGLRGRPHSGSSSNES